MRKPLFYSMLLASLSVASCSTILNNLPGVYTIDVQQGNIVDQSMVDQLRPGMSKRQVLYIMGSPMLKDPFHEDHWEYLYSVEPGGEDRRQKRITLYFAGDKVVGLQGDFKPGKQQILKAAPDATVDVPKRNLDESLWGMAKSWIYGDAGYDPSKREAQDKALKEESKGVWEKVTGWATGESAESEQGEKSEPAAEPEKSEQPSAPPEGETPEKNSGEAPSGVGR